MLKKIRGTSYPAAFVDWMIGTYGREELMPIVFILALAILFRTMQGNTYVERIFLGHGLPLIHLINFRC